jgi:hypothetical protein
MTTTKDRHRPASHCPWRRWRASQSPQWRRLASQSPGGGGGLTTMMTRLTPLTALLRHLWLQHGQQQLSSRKDDNDIISINNLVIRST